MYFSIINLHKDECPKEDLNNANMNRKGVITSVDNPWVPYLSSQNMVPILYICAMLNT